MIHVPDVAATVEWYRGIGFTVNDTYGRDGEGLSFAVLSFGATQVMFNQGGRTSNDRRREVDLYTYTDDVDQLYERLKDRVEVIEKPHDTFYGMREFIIRDINRFWITFGEDSAFGKLMNGVREGDAEQVQAALSRGSLSPASLTTALLAASSGDNKNSGILEMLTKSGAVLPPKVDDRILQSHTGHYESGQGMKVEIMVREGQILAVPAGQQALTLFAIDETTFRPSAFDGVTVSFRVEEGKTVGLQLKQGSEMTELKRVDPK
jgi:uncharacterized glyoxalase superfamily protein PhnB